MSLPVSSPLSLAEVAQSDIHSDVLFQKLAFIKLHQISVKAPLTIMAICFRVKKTYAIISGARARTRSCKDVRFALAAGR